MTIEERLRRDAAAFQQRYQQIDEAEVLAQLLEHLGLAPGSGIEPE